jgi:hypothetical protein
MTAKTLAFAAVLLLSPPVFAQTGQGGAGPAQGVTSGPAAGSPASMRSPQAGPLATKHQRKVVRNLNDKGNLHDKGNLNKGHQTAARRSTESGATESSTPRYATPPR